MDLGDGHWLLWVALALGAGIAEVLTLNLVFLMMAGGGVAAAVAGALGAGLPVELLVLTLTTAVLLVVARPPLLRYARESLPHGVTNAAALVGRDAEVVVEVGPDSGRVKLAGEVWSARAVAGALGPAEYPLEVGTTVRVVRIDGATAVVAPLPHRAGIAGSGGPDGPTGAQ